MNFDLDLDGHAVKGYKSVTTVRQYDFPKHFRFNTIRVTFRKNPRIVQNPSRY
jgi:hypothetical protein